MIFNYYFLVIPVMIGGFAAFVEQGPGTGWTIYPPLSGITVHSGCSVDLVYKYEGTRDNHKNAIICLIKFSDGHFIIIILTGISWENNDVINRLKF